MTLSDWAGHKVVMYFYPKAGTSGCTKQAVMLREIHSELHAKGLIIIGISPDSPETLAKFK